MRGIGRKTVKRLSKQITEAQRGDALVAAVRAMGSDARDVRDAAHEAAHALSWGVCGPWTRDNIHAMKPARRGDGVADEVMARGVEWLVCERLGIEYDLAKWAFTCWMEMLKNEGISLPTDGWLESAITTAKTSTRAAKLADQVMALAVQP